MKTFLTSLALLVGLVLNSYGASQTLLATNVSANSTNTVLVGPLTIDLLIITVASGGPANLKIYDSTNNVTVLAPTINSTNYGSAKVQVTEIRTNATYSFMTLYGHMTNIALTTTNITWMLRTTNYVTFGATNSVQAPRLAEITAPGVTTTAYEDLGLYAAKGVTIATDTNAVVVTIGYHR